eukprot:Em0002g1782a
MGQIIATLALWASGDNGEGDFPNEGHVVKDSDNCFMVWCTGRTGCDWMMAQLRKNYSTIVRTKDLDSSLMVVSDSSEAVTLLLSNQIVVFLNKNASSIEYIHLSDLYTGAARDSDDTESVPDKVPQKWLQFSYREKVQKGRLKVTQSLEKLQHSQRQEAAQQRKEDKKKAEKEKMLNEPDPEKTRKWEEKEHKKALKKMGPKMKQMKIKG